MFGTTTAGSLPGATEVAGVAASAANSPTGGPSGECISTASSEMRVDLTLDERSGKAPTEASRFDAMVVAEGAAAGEG